MGMLGQIRMVQRLQHKQMMQAMGMIPHGQNQHFYWPKKPQSERIVDGYREAYPLCWRYFENRISWGFNSLLYNHSLQQSLTQKQLDFLNNFGQKYYDKKKGRLVIKGKKGKDIFQYLDELIPDQQIFKLLYGKKLSWAMTTITASSRKNIVYRLPVLLTYNLTKLEKDRDQPQLIWPEKSEKTKIKKRMLKPMNLKTGSPYLYAKYYLGFVPV